MLNQFSRTQLLLGKEGMDRLFHARVAVFGIGGVGGYAVEALARVMRTELRKRGVKHLKVVYSKEKALTPIDDMAISCRAHCICPPGTARKCTQRRQVPGSNAYVPAVAGLICAGEVINDIALNRA